MVDMEDVKETSPNNLSSATPPQCPPPHQPSHPPPHQPPHQPPQPTSMTSSSSSSLSTSLNLEIPEISTGNTLQPSSTTLDTTTKQSADPLESTQVVSSILQQDASSDSPPSSPTSSSQRLTPPQLQTPSSPLPQRSARPPPPATIAKKTRSIISTSPPPPLTTTTTTTTSTTITTNTKTTSTLPPSKTPQAQPPPTTTTTTKTTTPPPPTTTTTKTTTPPPTTTTTTTKTTTPPPPTTTTTTTTTTRRRSLAPHSQSSTSKPLSAPPSPKNNTALLRQFINNFSNGSNWNENSKNFFKRKLTNSSRTSTASTTTTTVAATTTALTTTTSTVALTLPPTTTPSVRATTPDIVDPTNPFFEDIKKERSTSRISSRFNDISVSDLPGKFNEYLRSKRSEMMESRRSKHKIWQSVVHIVLVEAKKLQFRPDGSTPDVFVRFKLGPEKFKSKTKHRTLNPRWCEEFDLYLFDDSDTNLEISIRSADNPAKDSSLGECTIDINQYEEEKTHALKLPINPDNLGEIHILLSISFVGDLTLEKDKTPFGRKRQKKKDVKKYFTVWRTLNDFWRIGWLEIKVIKAMDLSTADLGGSSDPYCIVSLDNHRVQTNTVYKSVNPEWNRTFTMDIQDIHSAVEVTVVDENRSKKIDFLGKVAIPILQVKRGEKVRYQLKDIKLVGKVKGSIVLEIDYIYNPFRAAVRTFEPREKIICHPAPKFKIGTMKTNVQRAQKIGKNVAESQKLITSFLSWESKPKSLLALIIYCVCVLYLELYMIPLILIIIIMKNLVFFNFGRRDIKLDQTDIGQFEDEEFEDLDAKSVDSNTSDFELRSETVERIVKHLGALKASSSKIDSGSTIENLKTLDTFNKEERTSIIEKFQALQEVCLMVQEILDVIASIFERVRNLFLWRSPWLTSLAFFMLTIGVFVLYFIPIRYLLLVWGVRKFSRKLFDPNYVSVNELFEFINRLPSDNDLIHHKELPVEEDPKKLELKKTDAKKSSILFMT